MEFLLFLLFSCLHLLLFAGFSYYARILFFQKKEEYHREELIGLGSILPREILKVLESGGNFGLGLALCFAGIMLSGLWARLGGLIGQPHYAHSPGNYFFHFPLLFLAFTLGYSFLKDAFLGGKPSGSLARSFWDNAQAFSVGLGVGAISKTISSYGVYHEMYFVFVLVQYTIVGGLSMWLWNGERVFGIQLPGSRKSSSYADYYDSAEHEAMDDWDQNPSSEDFLDSPDWDDREDQENFENRP